MKKILHMHVYKSNRKNAIHKSIHLDLHKINGREYLSFIENALKEYLNVRKQLGLYTPYNGIHYYSFSFEYKKEVTNHYFPGGYIINSSKQEYVIHTPKIKNGACDGYETLVCDILACIHLLDKKCKLSFHDIKASGILERLYVYRREQLQKEGFNV